MVFSGVVNSSATFSLASPPSDRKVPDYDDTKQTKSIEIYQLNPLKETCFSRESRLDD